MKRLTFILLAFSFLLSAFSVKAQTKLKAKQIAKGDSGKIMISGSSIVEWQVPSAINFDSLKLRGFSIDSVSTDTTLGDGADNVIPTQGAVKGAIAANRIWVNVKDFGAKGDSSTDDTQAILNAIDWSYVNPSNGDSVFAKVIYFPPGDYITSNILFRDGQFYIGASRRNTQIIWKDGSTIGVNSDNLIARRVKETNLSVGSDVVFKDLTFNGNKDNVPADQSLSSMFGENITFINCNFVNTGSDAIRFTGNGMLRVIGCKFTQGQFSTGTSSTPRYISIIKSTTGTADTTYETAIVRGCYFESDESPNGNTNTGGIFVYADDGSNAPVVIEDNVFRNIGAFNSINVYGPIYLYRNASNSIIRNNRIFNSHYTGIHVADSRNVLIENNYIIEADTTGSFQYNYHPAALSYNSSANGFTPSDQKVVFRGNQVIGWKNLPAMQAVGSSGKEANNIYFIWNYIDSCGSAFFGNYFRNITLNGNVVKNINGNRAIEFSNSADTGKVIINHNIIKADANSVEISSGIYLRTNISTAHFFINDNKISGFPNYDLTMQNFGTAIFSNNLIDGRFSFSSGNFINIYGNISSNLTVNYTTGIANQFIYGNSWQVISPIYGQATFSGDGSNVSFSVSTSLNFTPSKIIITPTSSDAAKAQFWVDKSTILSTGFTVKVGGTTPPVGTDNIKIDYELIK